MNSRLMSSRMKSLAPHLIALLRAASKSCEQEISCQSSSLQSQEATHLLLTNVGHETNDIVALVDEPGHDARGVCAIVKSAQRCTGQITDV